MSGLAGIRRNFLIKTLPTYGHPALSSSNLTVPQKEPPVGWLCSLIRYLAGFACSLSVFVCLGRYSHPGSPRFSSASLTENERARRDPKELFDKNLADLRSSGPQFFEPHGSTKRTTRWVVMLTHSLPCRLRLLALCIRLPWTIFSSRLTAILVSFADRE